MVNLMKKNLVLIIIFYFIFIISSYGAGSGAGAGSTDYYKKAEIKGISKALLSRLKLSKEKLTLGIEGVRKVGNLSDPIGQIQIKKELYSQSFD